MTPPEQAPLAVVVTGLAGSGKSTFSRAVARALRGALLDKDAMVTPLTELLLAAHGEDRQQRESSALYMEQVFPAEYLGLLAVAADTLSVGTPVVIDAPFFAYLKDPGYLTRARVESGWPTASRTVVFWLTASPGTLRDRMSARGLERDRWKLENWDAYWSTASDLECTWEDADVVTIDIANHAPGELPPLVTEALQLA